MRQEDELSLSSSSTMCLQELVLAVAGGCNGDGDCGEDQCSQGNVGGDETVCWSCESCVGYHDHHHPHHHHHRHPRPPHPRPHPDFAADRGSCRSPYIALSVAAAYVYFLVFLLRITARLA